MSKSPQQKKHNPGSPTQPSRRQFALALSTVIGAGMAEHFLGGRGFNVAMAYQNDKAENKEVLPAASLFNDVQLDCLKVVCQTIIPATETLGAGDVDTHLFIENQLQHCFDGAAQKSIINTTKLIMRCAKRRHKLTFLELNDDQAIQLLADLEAGEKEFSNTHKEQFRFLKSLTVFGYYTSEEGASKELNYDAVPGGYKGSVLLADLGAAWGSKAYF